MALTGDTHKRGATVALLYDRQERRNQGEGMTEEAVTAEDRVGLAEDYDKARLDENSNEPKVEELGEGRERTMGAVRTGTNAQAGLVTQFPGAVERGLAEDIDAGGVAVRASKGLSTDGVTAEDRTWTAQSAQGYVADNSANVPGQTFTVEQLPDPLVVNGSGLPAHTIPEGLVVDNVRTDDINSSQEAGGDVATAPRNADRVTGNQPRVTETTPADVADGTDDARVGGRAVGRKAAR